MKKNKNLLPILLLVIVIILAVVYFVCRDKKDSYVKNSDEKSMVADESATWATYENKEIGIAFKYPKEWGDIIGLQITSNKDWAEDPVLKNLKYASFYVGKSNDSMNAAFSVSAGAGFMSGPRHISSEDVVTDYCNRDSITKDENLAGCKTYKNSNGLTIARVQWAKSFHVADSTDYGPEIVYYAYIGQNAFPGVMFTRRGMQDAGVMDKVADTLKKI